MKRALALCLLLCGCGTDDAEVELSAVFQAQVTCGQSGRDRLVEGLAVRLELSDPTTPGGLLPTSCDANIGDDLTATMSCLVPPTAGADLALVYFFREVGEEALTLAIYRREGVDLRPGAVVDIDLRTSTGTRDFDADTDGADNLSELCAGSDPRSAESMPPASEP